MRHGSDPPRILVISASFIVPPIHHATMSTLATDTIVRDCLVAVVTNDADLRRFTHDRWYRVPVRAVGRAIGEDALREARTLALYQTSGIRDGLPGTIELWGDVEEMLMLPRRDIIPEEPDHPAAAELYHLLRLTHIDRFPAPIVARRPRRLTFLRTTRDRLFSAGDINDLIVGSPAEERLWRALRENGGEMERHLFMRADDLVMEVDFALFQEERALGLLCDDVRWGHFDPADVIDAWRILRFSPSRLDRDLSGCLDEIAELLRRMREEGKRG